MPLWHEVIVQNISGFHGQNGKMSATQFMYPTSQFDPNCDRGGAKMSTDTAAANAELGWDMDHNADQGNSRTLATSSPSWDISENR